MLNIFMRLHALPFYPCKFYDELFFMELHACLVGLLENPRINEENPRECSGEKEFSWNSLKF